ncbi:hypothetical protein EGW08_004050 [Elysia chlorotica]|uniref:Uncharacterized protein n=1 Tax=Elysia chlorotica TaxID=188477 RepID=A0A433U389_ELYCH|nr:hypothetical protein EGW08_004050 [Elysia chlorotica]
MPIVGAYLQGDFNSIGGERRGPQIGPSVPLSSVAGRLSHTQLTRSSPGVGRHASSLGPGARRTHCCALHEWCKQVWFSVCHIDYSRKIAKRERGGHFPGCQATSSQSASIG